MGRSGAGRRDRGFEADARVVIGNRRVSDGEETVRRVRAAGGEAMLVRTDVTQAAHLEALVAKTVETQGRLDCAFNNAGITGDMARTAECTEENWDRTLS